MADEPTLREVLLRLDVVATQLVTLTAQIRDERAETARTFVRRDVYAAEQTAVTTRVTKIELDDEGRDKDASAFRRQLLFLILGISIPAIGALLLAVNNFLAAGGGVP